MNYRICYRCKKVRSNLILKYLGVCLWCKIKKLINKELKNEIS